MNQSFESCLNRQEEIKKLFRSASTPESKYQKIIELGKKLPPYPETLKTPEHIVQGCQSTLYLASTLSINRISFQAYSEALISSGLVYILLYIYSDQPPEAILKCPPPFLDDLGILSSLSPSRSNGLSSLYLKMQQEAIKHLLPSSKSFS